MGPAGSRAETRRPSKGNEHGSTTEVWACLINRKEGILISENAITDSWPLFRSGLSGDGSSTLGRHGLKHKDFIAFFLRSLDGVAIKLGVRTADLHSQRWAKRRAWWIPGFCFGDSFGLNTHYFANKVPSSQFSSVQSLSCVRLFAIPGIAAYQASLSITNSRSLLKLMPIESVMPSSHLILCRPLSSCPQSFPASGSFPMSQLFTWGGQSFGVSASASVLPMNTQDWSPLGWTLWISLQSKILSRVFSNTTVQKHQFFGAQLSLRFNSHIHTWPLEKP